MLKMFALAAPLMMLVPGAMAEPLLTGTAAFADWNSDHPGIGISFDPSWQIMNANELKTIKIMIHASSDAPQGTYEVFLPPGPCGGGLVILLTIGNCPYVGN